MSFSHKFLLFSIIVLFSLTTVFDFSPPILKQAAYPKKFVTIALSQNPFDFKPDQLFSVAAGSVVNYNLYVQNKGKLPASCAFSASSNKGYFVEIWRDSDQIGGGETQLIPPQGSTITLNSGEVATLVAKVTIPVDATSGTVDTTTIRLTHQISGMSVSVTLTTTVNKNLPYPSNWIQLGSDPVFPTPPPERIDVKAVYYTNNGTHLFLRVAEVSAPNPAGFYYCVYLDTKPGGEQIGSYNFDYLMSSDGVLYEWNGLDWIASGHSTYWQIDGTSMVLWSDLGNLDLEMQDIHVLSRSTKKDYTWKDEVGPFAIMRNNISEIPLILIPVLGFAVYFTISKRSRRRPMGEHSGQKGRSEVRCH